MRRLRLLRRFRRWRAELALDRLDAEIGRWYVEDGQLSKEPLSGRLSTAGLEFRARRLDAVGRLQLAGGHDPHPLWMHEPTSAQRAAYRR